MKFEILLSIPEVADGTDMVGEIIMIEFSFSSAWQNRFWERLIHYLTHKCLLNRVRSIKVI